MKTLLITNFIIYLSSSIHMKRTWREFKINMYINRFCLSKNLDLTFEHCSSAYRVFFFQSFCLQGFTVWLGFTYFCNLHLHFSKLFWTSIFCYFIFLFYSFYYKWWSFIYKIVFRVQIHVVLKVIFQDLLVAFLPLNTLAI